MHLFPLVLQQFIDMNFSTVGTKCNHYKKIIIIINNNNKKRNILQHCNMQPKKLRLEKLQSRDLNKSHGILRP
jgi:hypothetical protein